jgi:hypothetical protein
VWSLAFREDSQDAILAAGIAGTIGGLLAALATRRWILSRTERMSIYPEIRWGRSPDRMPTSGRTRGQRPARAFFG